MRYSSRWFLRALRGFIGPRSHYSFVHVYHQALSNGNITRFNTTAKILRSSHLLGSKPLIFAGGAQLSLMIVEPAALSLSEMFLGLCRNEPLNS